MLGILLVLAVAGFVAYPLMTRDAVVPRAIAESPAEANARARFALYRQVLDLELDEQTGKLAPDDRQELEADLLRRAALLMDEPALETAQADRADAVRRVAVERRIEEEIAAARRALAAARSPEASAAGG